MDNIVFTKNYIIRLSFLDTTIKRNLVNGTPVANFLDYKKYYIRKINRKKIHFIVLSMKSILDIQKTLPGNREYKFKRSHTEEKAYRKPCQAIENTNLRETIQM